MASRSSWSRFPPITLSAATATGVIAKMTNSMRLPAEDVRGKGRRDLRRDLPPPGIDSGQRWMSIRVVTKA